MAELVVALDYPDSEQALGMAKVLQGVVPWVKVGLELYTAAGPEVLARLKDMGFRVFLDLKFFDIPHTVRGAVCSAVGAGADMLNIHLMGGERMARAALEGLLQERDRATSAPQPMLLGVTVLTSMTREDLPAMLCEDVSGLVGALALSGKEWGLHGVVCSGHEVEHIKRCCGSDYICLTPGIRPAAADDDQRRVMTPGQAVRAGSDYLVVGRPVTAAVAPVEAAQRIMESMRQA